MNTENESGVKTAYIATLGCRLNHADTALLTRRLQEAGYRLTDSEEAPADLIVVNGCAVTAQAVKKTCRQVRHLKNRHPGCRLIATGCAAEAAAEELKLAGADAVRFNPGKRELLTGNHDVLSRNLPPENFAERVTGAFPFRSRAFIKIQEGCDNHCSYCIVPAVRGPSRSRKFAECVREAAEAAAAGFPELVLTGVNTCNYADDGKKLPDLIREIAAIPGNFRIRLSSTEPHPEDMTIPELLADPANRLCRFLHLSMQSGCNRILREMNRHYTAEQFINFTEKIRKLVPEIHLGSDFIIGFPGETEADFSETAEVIRNICFANCHLFIYSPRPGTPAAELPGRIAPEIAKERMRRLQELAAACRRAFRQQELGKKLPVIFEQTIRGRQWGWSDNYLRISAPAGSLPEKQILEVTATAENTFCCDEEGI